MTWYPISHYPFQYINPITKAPYSGAVLKAYSEETSNVIAMATSYLGTSTASSITLNSAGYPVYSGNVIIPHVQEDFKLALYPDQASADADSGALWTVDDIQIAATSNSSFQQDFSGDNATVAFTLSQDLGSDENTILVFVDNSNKQLMEDSAFADTTKWTKGAGWTVAAGTATATGAISTNITQTDAVAVTPLQAYVAEITITRSAGTVTPSIGGTAGTARSADGTYKEVIIAGATTVVGLVAAGFTGTCTLLSLTPVQGYGRQILDPTEFTLSGTTLTLHTAPATGTNNIKVWAPSLLVGAIGALAAAAAISESNAAASAASALAISLAAGAWTKLTADGNLTVNAMTLMNKAGSRCVGTLPAPADGDIIDVSGISANGWQIAQLAGQQIIFGNMSTTVGVGGYLASTNRYDKVRLKYSSDAAAFLVVGSIGNITVN